ncbi:hypothetical protein APHAL10511_001940 [Amanita phalloides]|nr:hypothetical protein APHAL10511_001940 [Amanita phalloides]
MVRTAAITEYMPDFAGHVIDKGRLKLLDSLGSGAYGKVYRAVDKTAPKARAKYYAVKCLCKPKPGSRQDEFQTREIAIHRLVHNHPNIVTLHKVISDDFFVYVVFDLYAGGDLFTAITERAVFKQNDRLIKHTFVQLIDAVHYCHEKSVFHRDIKPENVLVSEDGSHVCLADFGLSTLNRVCAEFGCGSSYYMSPECIGKEITCGRYSTLHSDIWSLGVILTNMISGRNPWRYATTDDECFVAYLHDNDFLRRVLPISEGANNILKKIFNLNPLRRISLPELREEILKLDTFFLTEGHPRIIGSPAYNHANNSPKGHSAVESTVDGSSRSSDEHYKFKSPDVDETSATVTSTSVCNPYPAGQSNCTPTKEINSGSTGSGQESEGPVTPASKPIDPKLQVPDIQDEMEGLAINSDANTPNILSKIRKPFAKRSHLFRFAVTRLVGTLIIDFTSGTWWSNSDLKSNFETITLPSALLTINSLRMVSSSVLGFPRIGANREVKKAVESYWAGKISADDLTKAAAEVKKESWTSVKSRGVNFIPSGEFSLYDHVLDHSAAFNVIPRRYVGLGLSPLDVYFAMGRGRQAGDVDVPASEMKKWFDSNYHYVVPEFSEETDFKLNFNKALEEYREAQASGITTRPVILGPVSFLVLGKVAKGSAIGFQPISLLSKLLPVYKTLLADLKSAGVEWVQIDEPILVLDIGAKLEREYTEAYSELSAVSPKIMLTTYFGRLDSNLNYVAKLPIAGLHIDLDRAPAQLDDVITTIRPTPVILSLGLVSGRNIWKTDCNAAIKLGQKAVEALGQDRVIVATSSSLLHTPVTLTSETKLSPEQKDWFSFALEKASEVAVIAAALAGSQDGQIAAALEENRISIAKRREFERSSNDAVRRRVEAITPDMLERKNPFAIRKELQARHLDLPKFPTTTIGSFPQTKEIRLARAKLTKKEITKEEYEEFIKKEIQHAVRFQERIGLDLLVHGEPERNDMVQYFGEQLHGFVFTQNAWVQSYGSRYVRPPIIVSDISRPGPMTVRWSEYAQSITTKPMKGMLTGPVTILNWSFPRADVSRELQSKQLALALRDEVIDLEKAGIKAIQVDEPAIREGLPLRRSDWDAYLKWAVDSFKLATAGVTDQLQTHSHFCYSDFNDIFPSIQRLDADVISIEASKSDMKLLNAFKTYGYSNQIGPGVYDIHSPRVPSQQEIKDRLRDTLAYVPADLLFVNPDCGLKTRAWKETEASLINVVQSAKWARENYA